MVPGNGDVGGGLAHAAELAGDVAAQHVILVGKEDACHRPLNPALPEGTAGLPQGAATRGMT